jgi:hypothetical protein
MVCFHTQNSNFGKFWTVFKWKMWVFFMAMLSNLRPNGIFYGHVVYFMSKWYILWPFGGHFGIFFPVLVCCPDKNLATLLPYQDSPPPTAQSIKVKKLAKTIRHPEGEFTS